MERETLEEATKIFLNNTKQIFYFEKGSLLWEYLINISHFGAKWQSERMYSEEELREAIHESRIQDDTHEEYIFEQFKKK